MGEWGQETRIFEPVSRPSLEYYWNGEYSRITVACVSHRVTRGETIDRFTADSLLSLSLHLCSCSSVNFDRPRWINFRRSALLLFRISRPLRWENTRRWISSSAPLDPSMRFFFFVDQKEFHLFSFDSFVGSFSTGQRCRKIRVKFWSN